MKLLIEKTLAWTCAAAWVFTIVSLAGPAFGAELSVRDAVAKLDASVVELRLSNRSHCTAFKIGPNRYMSAGHCFSTKTGKYKVEHDLNYGFVSAVLTSVSKKDTASRRMDWAVFYTAGDPLEEIEALPLSCNEEVYVGMRVATMGYPGPVNRSFNMGYVASKDHESRNNNADYVIDLQAGPGASGSPIISMETGNVIGILTEGVPAPRVGFFMTGAEAIGNFRECEGKEGTNDTGGFVFDGIYGSH